GRARPAAWPPAPSGVGGRRTVGSRRALASGSPAPARREEVVVVASPDDAQARPSFADTVAGDPVEEPRQRGLVAVALGELAPALLAVVRRAEHQDVEQVSR